MIQDIFPQDLRIEYANKSASEDSVIFCFDGDMVFCGDNSKLGLPLYKELKNNNFEYIYLFAIDGVDYFLAKQGQEEQGKQELKQELKFDGKIELSEFEYKNISIFRTMKSKSLAFAGLTAYHLSCFYDAHKFCGRCKNILTHSENERALSCHECKNIIYPKISPAIIVGVIDGSKLLMTKYANRDYKKYSLIAGFTDVGESAEETVKREVFEEVGLKVKNVKYYKSQPWGFSGSLLLGYFADLDGSADINLDENELSEAVWVERNEINVEFDDFSLTNEMICKFKSSRHLRGVES